MITLKCLPSRKWRHFRRALTMAAASFLTAWYLISLELRVLEKNATGRPCWFRVAAMQYLLASVSTSNSLSGSTIISVKFFKLFFSTSKENNTGGVRRNSLLLFNNNILSEKFWMNLMYRGPTIFFGHFEKNTSRWSLVPKTFEIVST